MPDLPSEDQVEHQLIGAAKDAFAAREWVYQEVPGRAVLEAAFDAHHTRVALHVQAFAAIGAISVVSRSSPEVTPTHRAAVNDLLMTANQSLTVGNFELAPGNSIVLFRATNLFPGGEGDPAIIARLVHAGVSEIDRLTPALSIVVRTTVDQLHTLNSESLLEREDLIPPPADRGRRVGGWASQNSIRDLRRCASRGNCLGMDVGSTRSETEPLRVETDRTGGVFTVRLGEDTIEFETSGPVAPDPPNDVFALWAALPVAMRLGRDIRIAGRGCATAAANAAELSRTWEAWAPTRLRSVNVAFDSKPDPGSAQQHQGNERDLVLFSGGADSTYALLRRREQGLEQGLLTLHGLDYRRDDLGRFEALKAQCSGFASSVASEWSFIRTNAYEVYRKHGVGPGITHGFILSAGVFLYEGPHYRDGVIAADHDLRLERWAHPWGTNSLTNPLFRSSSFRLSTESLDTSRAEKLARIREDPVALASVSFCKDYEHRPKNCGVCKKCLRSKMMFIARFGNAPDIFTDASLPEEPFASIRPDDRIEFLNLIDTLAMARRHGNLGRLPGLEKAIKALAP